MDFRSHCTAFSTELWELLQVLTVVSTVQFGLDRRVMEQGLWLMITIAVIIASTLGAVILFVP